MMAWVKTWGWRWIAIVSLLLGGSPVAWAEAENRVPPDEGGHVESMGQPPLWMPYVGLAAGAYEPASDFIEPTGTLTVGLFRNL